MYSLFTGLSSLSKGFWDFAAYRFLTGLGVGGEFAVGVALVAESLPAAARSYALGLLQALSAVGNISAAFINIWIGRLESSGVIGGPGEWSAWRWMFLIGALPALLALIIRWRLKEPEAWVRAKQSGEHQKKEFGSYRVLFKTPRWRRNAIIGVTLACSGVFALWGIVFYCFELVRGAFRPILEAQGLSAAEVEGGLKGMVGRASFWLNIGAFLGMIAFSYLTQWLGRRKAFAITYVGGMVATAGVFWLLRDPAQIPWMLAIMGFFVLGLFAGYAIYLPELFPTHLRSTGTSFCYNVGRYVGAFAPSLLGLLTSEVFSEANGFKEGIRYAGIAMCSVFVVGLVVLPFAPETKDQPLPE
jgi:MFS family permease